MKILAVNRFFETREENAEAALGKIGGFVERVLAVPEVTTLYVAINPADRSGALDHLRQRNDERLYAEVVSPWGKFVPPFNAALEYARGNRFDAMLCLSTEVELTSEIVQTLAGHLSNEALVVGARLDGHTFQTGWNGLTGTTVPWNTCAIWSISKLQRLGFPLVGEALYDATGKEAGVEEQGAIAAYQQLYQDCAAKLMEVPGINWDTSELDEERKAKHDAKMRSKEARPAAQLRYAKLEGGSVFHLA